MQITKCLHTAIHVSDLKRAEYFYGTILGLEKVERPMKFPGTWYQVGDYQIHLIVAPNVTPEALNEKWGRNPHIAFAVADIDAAKKQLIDNHFPVQTSNSGRPAIFAQDPDGNIVELSQQ